jgi:class 3 adenylate cyclase/tetratricopeptide (TPR) repeat protein
MGTPTVVESYLPRSLLSRVVGASALDDAVFEESWACALSVDIAGFTRITERLERDPAVEVDRLSRILNAFYGDLIGRVEAHGGDLVSIVGDGTIAAWLCDASDLRSTTHRAATCGLELSRVFDRYRADAETELRIRTGLGCGQLSIARLGSPARFELTVAGDAVSDAVTAEQLATPGGFAVSPRAWHLLPDDKRGSVLPSGFVQLGSLPEASKRSLSVPAHAYDETTLLSYLPLPVRKRVTSSQAALWQAEMRYVTVAFFRFRTADGHDLGLDRAQEAILLLRDALEHFGGAIDKVTFHDKGCVATALFGLPPHSHEDDARRAVAAALEMLERARAHGIDVSAGVATGLVFWGPIGHALRRQFGVVGSAMNLGSRLMQLAESNVLCCPRTVEALANRAGGEHIGHHVLKGFEHPVAVFRARTISHGSSRTRSLGRASESERLRAMLGVARQRQGGLIWLEAGPGLGKSTLVSELYVDALRAGISVLMVNADAVEQSTPLHAWKGPLAQLLGIDASASIEDNVARTVARVDALPGLEGAAPLLSQALGLPIAESPSTQRLEGLARADRTADLLLALLEGASSRGLLVILEDLHWFDSASLRVAHLARRRLDRLAFVVTTRARAEHADEIFHALRRSAQVIELGPLPEICIRALVASGLGARSVSDESCSFVNQRAEGNPLFAKSLARELGAAGVLRVEEGRVELQREAARVYERLPPSLDAIIGARVDRLSAADSITLKAASAVGASFQLDVLLAVHPESLTRDQLVASLRVLQAEKLVVSQQVDVYAFDHAVTHEVTYARIAPHLRETLHAGIARWIEASRAVEAIANQPLLAHHYERSGQTRLACLFLTLAADQALRAGAFREGASFLQRAIAISGRKPHVAVTPLRRARWNRQLAETLDSLGEKQHIEAPARRALLELGQSEPQTSVGQYASLLRDAAMQAITQTLNLRLSPKPPEVAYELSRAHLCLTVYYFYAMNPVSMVASTLRATNAAEHADRLSERARCYAGMTLWLGIVGQQRLARGYATRALEACHGATDDPGVVSALCGLALHHIGVGEFQRADECCRRAQQVAEPANDHNWWCVAQAISIWSLTYRGRRDVTRAAIAELAARAKGADSENLGAWARRFEAHSLLSAGKASEAAEMFLDVLVVVKRHADRGEQLLVQGSLALALIRAGRQHEARAILDETFELLRGLMRPTSHIVLTGLCDMMESIQVLLRDRPRDRELLTYRANVLVALANYQRSFPIGVARAQHFIGHDALSRGRPRQARAAFQRGLLAAETLGLPGEMALLKADLACCAQGTASPARARG